MLTENPNGLDEIIDTYGSLDDPQFELSTEFQKKGQIPGSWEMNVPIGAISFGNRTPPYGILTSIVISARPRFRASQLTLTT